MKLQYTMVFVSDTAKAKQFYNGKLGFKVVADQPETKSVMFETPDGRNLGVHVPSEASRHKAQIGRSTGILFLVPNVDEAVKEMQAKGVTFTKTSDPRPERKDKAYFVDDDGNEYGLIEQLM